LGERSATAASHRLWEIYINNEKGEKTMLKRIIKIGIMFFCLFFICSCTNSREDKFNIQQETEHFKFYCSDDNISDIDGLSEELENQYQVISSHLQTKISKKVEVIIYPNIDSLYNIVAKKEKISKNEIPDWVAAISYQNNINMISPSNTEYTRNSQNIHLQAEISLAEIIIKNINKNTPYYLMDSVPRYETNLYNGVKEDVVSDFANNTVPTLQQVMDTDEDDDISSLSYFTFAEYIIDEYGYEKIIDLINNKNIEQCLGKSKEEIENDWINYVKLTYTEDGFETSMETEHFVIQYNESDSDIANNISQIVESNYERITRSFNINMDEKYNIIIYPDANVFKKARLHDVYNGINTNAVTGYFLPNTDKIKILSPNDLDSWSLESNLESLIIHEFTHAVIMQINQDIPSYLNEGVANYMSNDMETSAFLLNVVPALRDDTFPSIDVIKNMQLQDYVEGSQHFECAFVMYIVENYGYQKLTEFIKIPDIQTVFDITEEQFQNDMLESLKRKYIN
jgi:hypothetical protein